MAKMKPFQNDPVQNEINLVCFPAKIILVMLKGINQNVAFSFFFLCS